MASWWSFAVAIQEEALRVGLLNRTIPIKSITSGEYAARAARPEYSVLDCSKSQQVINMRPAQWRTNLRRMLEELASTWQTY